MKTNYFFTLTISIILLTSISTKAQVHFGMRHGVAVSTISKIGKLTDNAHMQVHYSGGLFSLIEINDKIRFQPELNFISIGRDKSEISFFESDNLIRRNDYLQIPLLLNIKCDCTRLGTNIFFLAGPYASYLINSKNTKGDTNLSFEIEKSKKLDFGGTLGIGAEFKTFGQLMLFDVRYNMGLKTIIETPEERTTKSMVVALGIRF